MQVRWVFEKASDGHDPRAGYEEHSLRRSMIALGITGLDNYPSSKGPYSSCSPHGTCEGKGAYNGSENEVILIKRANTVGSHPDLPSTKANQHISAILLKRQIRRLARAGQKMGAPPIWSV
ncbi:MAG: hypothetical protein P8Q48_03245 [Paracoccaceae bacterium]|nr:hypothetical protein [Paracoccaceae bacterium]